MKTLLALALMTTAFACSSNQDKVKPAPTAPVADTQPTQASGTEPVLGPDGVPQNCSVLYEGLCYQRYEDACAAAQCPTDRCSVMESYPGQIACRSAEDAGAQ